VDERTAEHYATIYVHLKRKGRPIPTNDMWIAASALRHGFALFTYDGHFQYISGLFIGKTLEDFLL
jgi:tRNA(fMet)-specific endonuclease VapC